MTAADVPVVIRMTTLAVLVLVCSPSLVAAARARGTAISEPLLAVAVLTASAVYSQISLLGTPVSSRTWVNLAAAVVVGALLVRGALRGPDPAPDPLADLPERTRDLIHRHPELLDSFANWHRNHTEDRPT